MTQCDACPAAHECSRSHMSQPQAPRESFVLLIKARTRRSAVRCCQLEALQRGLLHVTDRTLQISGEGRSVDSCGGAVSGFSTQPVHAHWLSASSRQQAMAALLSHFCRNVLAACYQPCGLPTLLPPPPPLLSLIYAAKVQTLAVFYMTQQNINSPPPHDLPKP